MRFLSDDEKSGGYAVALEVDCLQQKFGTTDNVLKEYPKGKKDVGNVPIFDVISGPLKANMLDNGKWDFTQYPAVRDRFEQVKKLEREKLYNSFICAHFGE